MRFRIIEDGNLSFLARLILALVGIGLAAIAVFAGLPVAWNRALLLIGFGIALVGGMASRAKILHIKPFDNSYKKARDSYKVKDDDDKESEK
jgi:hypothetical protein